MLPKNRQPTHPGEILLEDFLIPMEISQLKFSQHLGWSYAKINEIVNGKRGISPETALSLADALETTPEFWITLQGNYDLWSAKQKHQRKKKIAI